eukprot:gnl/MRDRNA2_/MRDRNA2_104670_c0_seq1.p1 gnl/MRDRNA2_/MRDRNA2_104670_c0~~gnl/MRDRNA2_/MRDRNA2_104670_c0_seq1.p1  ORF type:complete len:944 (+),score=196.65 gnl/MRDRNA2_/MRDRNA2_104670_c0_seq1:76-2907(+)
MAEADSKQPNPPKALPAIEPDDPVNDPVPPMDSTQNVKDPQRSPSSVGSLPKDPSSPQSAMASERSVKPKYANAHEGFSTLKSMQPMHEDAEEFIDAEDDENTRRLIKASLRGQDSVTREELEAYLQWDIDSLNACVKFPLTFLYFVFFANAVLSHEDISSAAIMQRGITNMITGTTYEGIHYDSGHKDIADIAAKEDVYLFMKEAVLPNFMNPKGTEDLFRVMRLNQIVGGIQVQQLRRAKRPCEKEYPEIGPYGVDGRTNPMLAGFSCYPHYRASDECFVPEGMPEREGMDKGFCADKMFKRGSQDMRRLQVSQPENVSSEALDKNISSHNFFEFYPDVEDKNGVNMAVYDRALKPEGLSGTGTDYPGAEEGAESDGSGKTFTVYMYEHEGLAVAQQKVDWLQEHGWIDHATAWVGIRFLLLNPDLGVFVHASIHVWFPPSGAVMQEVSTQSFLPEPYQHKSIIALDVLWGFTLFCLLATIFKALYKAAASKEGGACRKWWGNAWHWLDVFTALGGIAVVIFWLVVVEQIEQTKSNVIEVRTHTPGANEEVIGYSKMVAALHESTNKLSTLLSAFRVCLCLYTILIVGQFFEAFNAQPRLAMVTNTIARASIDLIHFFVVWFLVFMAYAIAGMQIFGRRMHQFADLKAALNQCFVIMLGDFDWDEIGAEHPATAGVWFWSFTILISMIILNMIMAIIMDTYTEVKADASDSEDLFTQLRQIGGEILGQLQNDRISAYQMSQAIQDIPPGQDMGVEDLIHAVSAAGHTHMSFAQARDTIKETKKRVEKQLAGNMGLTDAMNSIGWIKVATDKIRIKLNEILTEDIEEGEQLKEVLGLKGPEDEEEKPTFDFAPHLDQVESRMTNIEHFMNEAMQYTSFRSADMRNRLCVIEDLLRSQRDAVLVQSESAFNRGGGQMQWSTEKERPNFMANGRYSQSQMSFSS